MSTEVTLDINGNMIDWNKKLMGSNGRVIGQRTE